MTGIQVPRSLVACTLYSQSTLLTPLKQDRLCDVCGLKYKLRFADINVRETEGGKYKPDIHPESDIHKGYIKLREKQCLEWKICWHYNVTATAKPEFINANGTSVFSWRYCRLEYEKIIKDRPPEEKDERDDRDTWRQLNTWLRNGLPEHTITIITNAHHITSFVGMDVWEDRAVLFQTVAVCQSMVMVQPRQFIISTLMYDVQERSLIGCRR